VTSTAVFVASMVTGCKFGISQARTNNLYKQTSSDTTGKQNANQQKTMEQYQSLLENNASLIEIANFMDGNVSLVSSDNAVAMVDEFEKRQKEFLPELEKKFSENVDIQNKMAETFLQDFDISKIYSIEDEKIQELLKETKDSGYKVETAEGMFFPVINYEAYKKFRDFVSNDFRDYIDLMAIESNNTPAKDAALIISWEEILKRALNQEKFIAQYPDSKRIDNVKGLYKKYLTFTLFGLNNTPLFSYDSNEIDSEAKQAYMEVLKTNADNSNYLAILSDYMSLLEENNYKLTDEIIKYRDEVIKKLD
jgi:hypothetical protein